MAGALRTTSFCLSTCHHGLKTAPLGDFFNSLINFSTESVGTGSLPLRFGYDLFCLNKAIGIDGDGIDAALDEECRDLRIIAGRFAANAHFALLFMCVANDIVNHAFHRFISFVEKVG